MSESLTVNQEEQANQEAEDQAEGDAVAKLEAICESLPWKLRGETSEERDEELKERVLYEEKERRLDVLLARREANRLHQATSGEFFEVYKTIRENRVRGEEGYADLAAEVTEAAEILGDLIETTSDRFTAVEAAIEGGEASRDQLRAAVHELHRIAEEDRERWTLLGRFLTAQARWQEAVAAQGVENLRRDRIMAEQQGTIAEMTRVQGALVTHIIGRIQKNEGDEAARAFMRRAIQGEDLEGVIVFAAPEGDEPGEAN